MLGPVIVDTNLLLLIVVGAADPDYIDMHKRLRADYTAADFIQISQLIGLFSDILVIPNTLTEVSNFARQIANPARAKIQDKFRHFVEGANEIYIASRAAVSREEFADLGLTDAAILQICSVLTDDASPTLLSVDEDLINTASSLGYGYIDYNQLR